jgi:hypothetical protein
MRNVFLCWKLDITHIPSVAGDFFVKLEAFISCTKNIVLKFLPNVLRGYTCSHGGLHYSEKSKAANFKGNSVRR